MLRLLFIFLTTTLLLNCSHEHSPQGPGTSGGGSFTESSFRETGKILIENIQQLEPLTVEGFDLNSEQLIQLLKNAKVSATEKKLYVNKVEKDAVNDFANQSIIINIEAWENACPILKDLIVLHELIGLLRTHEQPKSLDEDYVISRKVVELIHGQEAWGTNCSPFAYIGMAPEKEQVETTKPSASFNGLWLGHAQIRGIGKDKEKWYDCRDDAKLSEWEEMLPYDFEFSATIKLEDKRVIFSESIHCPLKIESESDFIGTVHPITQVESSGYSSDNQWMDIEEGQLFASANGRKFKLGYISANIIEIALGEYMQESYTLSEDAQTLKFHKVDKDPETGESFEVKAEMIRWSTYKQGLSADQIENLRVYPPSEVKKFK